MLVPNAEITFYGIGAWAASQNLPVAPCMMADTSQTSFGTQKNHVMIFPDAVATI